MGTGLGGRSGWNWAFRNRCYGRCYWSHFPSFLNRPAAYLRPNSSMGDAGNMSFCGRNST